MQQIMSELEASRFGLIGFDVSFPDSGNDIAVVAFLGKKGMSLRMGLSGGADERVLVRTSPGDYKTQDFDSFASFDDAVSTIQPWTRRIYEDLKVRLPDVSEIDAFRQTLDAHVKNSIPDENAQFTPAEVDDLSAKLAALEARLQEMEQRHLITEKELKELKQVIGEARNDLPTLPKGMWYRTAGGKVWEVVKKAASTSEARQLIADAAKKLLGI